MKVKGELPVGAKEGVVVVCEAGFAKGLGAAALPCSDGAVKPGGGVAKLNAGGLRASLVAFCAGGVAKLNADLEPLDVAGVEEVAGAEDDGVAGEGVPKVGPKENAGLDAAPLFSGGTGAD